MKRNDGYVLLYVLAVLVVLALLALTVSSVALGNLRGQQAAVRDMQDRYAAEGVLERLEAGLQELSLRGDGQENAAKTAFEARLGELCGEISVTSADPVWREESGVHICSVTVSGGTEGTEITAELEIPIRILVTEHRHELPPEEGTGDQEPTVTYTYTYTLSAGEIAYRSYDISTPEGREEAVL